MDVLLVLGAYLLGAIPFAQIVSVRLHGTDLRAVGTGTVSGTGLYRVGGFGAVALGGGLDVVKGALAAMLAGDDSWLAVGVSAAVVIGHCWSVFLRGAGGRGLSPAMGALAVLYWPGAVLLLAALAIGRLAKETGLAAFISDLVLVVVLTVTHKGWGLALAGAVVLPMLIKRVLGNNRLPADSLRIARNRLLYDSDRHVRREAARSDTLDATVRLLAARLDRHRDELNRLNVYPVVDGDTGDNLVAMMDAVTARLPGDVVDAVATGALYGGRGSSGVIFGQALRGFVTNLPATYRGADLAAALTAAAASARDAVGDPVEGTILTVADDAAQRATTAASSDGSIADVAGAAAEEGRRSLMRTPDLLPVLAQARVVDAGGLGYVLFLDALAEAVSGLANPPLELASAAQPAVVDDGAGGRYEVMCLIAADRDRLDALRQRWLSLGDTIAIAGGDHTWRCHVHTDDVDGALAAAHETGDVSDVEVTDLAGQHGGAVQ